MQVQVIGCGVVGGALAEAAEARGHEVARFDPNLGLSRWNVDAKLALVCVGTPPGPGGVCDTSQVEVAVKEAVVRGFRGVLAIRSTVPPGTNDRLRDMAGAGCILVAWPEFLRAATAKQQTARPAYHVWGLREVDRWAVLPILHRFGPPAPTLVMTPTEAEFCKYASNVMIAGQITMANQLYDLALAADVDWEPIEAYARAEPLIGNTVSISPERGFGGACLPKDLQALMAWGNQKRLDISVLGAVWGYNESIRKAGE